MELFIIKESESDYTAASCLPSVGNWAQWDVLSANGATSCFGDDTYRYYRWWDRADYVTGPTASANVRYPNIFPYVEEHDNGSEWSLKVRYEVPTTISAVDKALLVGTY